MFSINQEYERQELLDFVGSKDKQSGIIWGDKEPGSVIITAGGKHGVKAGYENVKNEDGSWLYIGQGSKGDHDKTRYSNSLLVGQQRNVLLFSTREPTAKEQRKRGNKKKLYLFEGIFDVLSYRFIAGEGNRKNDQLLQFHLIPANNIYDSALLMSAIDAELNKSSKELKELKEQILRYLNPHANKGKEITPKEYRRRSVAVKTYALKRANGVCERCENKAPFITPGNIPFLEVHHILKLADDGPDLPENVSAICPNCHREAHFGFNRQVIMDQLKSVISEKESQI